MDGQDGQDGKKGKGQKVKGKGEGEADSDLILNFCPLPFSFCLESCPSCLSLLISFRRKHAVGIEPAIDGFADRRLVRLATPCVCRV